MRVLCLLLTLLLPGLVCAENSLLPLLNKISLSLHAEQWVTTKSALVSVGINAAVSGQGIEKVQNDVINKLNQLSNKGEWHIISFDRQLDKSGLENIQITAQARLMQNDIVLLRDKAKNLSQPGETFTIDNVQFVPSEDEIKQANLNLRSNIYQQAITELATLKGLYPDQQYYLYQIDFLSPSSPVAPMAETAFYASKTKNEIRAARTPLSIGNKQELQAIVILASIPNQFVQIIQKLPHTPSL
jgi:hypothetical protein